MKSYKTVSVDRTNLHTYRKRAEECLRLADLAYEQKLWFGTCINAVHAGISLADCLSIFKRGTRYAGSSHDEAVQFYGTLNLDEVDFRQSISHLGKLISVKHAAEYADQTLTEKDAQASLKALSRLREFVFKRLPK